MDLLLWLKRRLDKPADVLRLRPAAQRVFRWLVARRYASDRLARTMQNGREWLLHPEVALRGEYAEFETIEWLRRVVRPGDCVVDVGANVGQMTLEAAELVGPGGKVLAVEPAPGNLKLLRLHVTANGYADRVDIVAAACAAEPGTATLRVYGGDEQQVGSGHTIRTQGVESESPTVEVQVDATSLDALVRTHRLRPAVLKIDVEGAELDVIRGARDTLQACQPRVRIGFHPFAFADPAAATAELRGLMAAAGYDMPEAPDGCYQLDEYEAAPRSAAPTPTEHAS